MYLENLKIGVIGLGYVGLPLAVEFGKKRKTIGFDINRQRVKELSDGQDHTLEVLTVLIYLHYKKLAKPSVAY